MGVDGFPVLDADAHVVEPPEVFGAWADVSPGAIDLPADTPMVPCGDFDLIQDQLQHAFDAPSYLRGMDAQGIDAVVLYPSIGLFVPFQPELDPADERGGMPVVQRVDRRLLREGPPADVRRRPGPAGRRRPGRGRGEAGRRPRARRSAGPAEPSLRPQPRRCRLRPALRHAGRRRRGPGRARGPGVAGPDHRGRPLHVVHRPPPALAPARADGGHGQPGSGRCPRPSPDAAGGLPRVGDRLAAVLAAPAGRAPRVGGQRWRAPRRWPSPSSA